MGDYGFLPQFAHEKARTKDHLGDGVGGVIEAFGSDQSVTGSPSVIGGGGGAGKVEFGHFDKQLALYTEATRVTGTIATSSDSKEIEEATRRFWELYWGELGLVEHTEVEEAMVGFGKALDAKIGRDKLAPLALNLAKACRKELATSWGTDAWKRK